MDQSLFTATDASHANRIKISDVAPNILACEALSGDELGLVMGRERIAFVLVEAGGLANRLAREIDRLCGLRVLPEAT